MTFKTTTTDVCASMKAHNLKEHQGIPTIEPIIRRMSDQVIGNTLPRTMRARLGKVKCGDRKSRTAVQKEVQELAGMGADEQTLETEAPQFEDAKQDQRKGVRGPRERVARMWNKGRNAAVKSMAQRQQAQPRALCH